MSFWTMAETVALVRPEVLDRAALEMVPSFRIISRIRWLFMSRISSLLPVIIRGSLSFLDCLCLSIIHVWGLVNM